MNSRLLNSEIQNFISLHIDKNISELALQKNPFPDFQWIEIVNQISAKAKAKVKLPTWFTTKDILYPDKISIEQSSSEEAAIYKSSLLYGQSLIDLSGGFGVDSYYFSKKMEKVVHCEIDAELSKIVQHNFEKLNVHNVECQIGNSLTILQKLDQRFDWIYIDPSRRHDIKGKVFMFEDCSPNIPAVLNTYFNYSSNILIKTAPILDITAGLSELKHVKTIHIVSIENEVKELLWQLSTEYFGSILIKTINIGKKEVAEFEFVLNGKIEKPTLGLPKKYLFEPNNAIMKSGGFNEVAVAYGIEKLHQHSHLYTTDSLRDFPGRVFEIVDRFFYTKANMKRYLENQQINITTRNFPDNVISIRKKWKIKDGGSSYCFFTTDVNNDKIVLICNKIK